jgi:hypothetical protein
VTETAAVSIDLLCGKMPEMYKNADVCSALFRSRVRRAEQKWAKLAKTPIIVPGCPRRALSRWDKNGQKR